MRLASWVGGAFAALVFLEAGLRLAEVVFPAGPPAARTDSRGPILLLGDAYLGPATPGPEKSVAQALSELLARRASGRGPGVLLDAEPARNSSELLARLPELLDRSGAGVVVLMAGDGDFWNFHHLHLFLDAHPSARGFFSQLRVARLLTGGPPAFPSPPSGNSAFFLDVPREEYPTLAMRWTGFLLAHRPVTEPAARVEAEAALRAWLKDPRGFDQPFAVRALAELLRGQGRDSDAARVEAAYRARGQSEFAGAPAGFAASAREAARLMKEHRPAQAKGLLREAFRRNPFAAGGEPPSYEFYRFLSPVTFRDLLAEALPPAVAGAEKPGLRTLRESLLDPGVPPAWLAHDLGVFVRYAWGRGIPVLLATYPPDRFTGRERDADAVIRRVAGALGVPLSDVSGELRRRWPAGVAASFYEAADSDRLNGAGRALVAEILLGDLERFHLAP